MNDRESLVLLLTLFYLWECLLWLPEGVEGFIPQLRRGHRWRRRFFNSWRGYRMLLKPPLPPLGTSFIASHSFTQCLATLPPWPAGGSDSAPPPSILARRRKILLGDRLLWRTVTPQTARWQVQQWQSYTATPPEQREATFHHLLKAATDTDVIHQKVTHLRETLRPIRTLSNVLFCYLILAAPIVFLYDLERIWPWLLGGLLLQTLSLSTLFYRAHRRLYPEDADDRITYTCIFALFAPGALRVHDALSLPLLERYHPCAVARVLCSDEHFRSHSEDVLRRLHFRDTARATACSKDKEAQKNRGFDGLQLEIDGIKALLAEAGSDPEAYLAAPTRQEGCQLYCPRCHAQYARDPETCSDCGYGPCLPFPHPEDLRSDANLDAARP